MMKSVWRKHENQRDTVEILRHIQVQQGHHRLANTIKHKRTINVIIK